MIVATLPSLPGVIMVQKRDISINCDSLCTQLLQQMLYLEHHDNESLICSGTLL